jgi:hypothetical protein
MHKQATRQYRRKIMKTKVKYDEEELEVVRAWQAGALKPVGDMAQRLKDHRGIAEASLKKTSVDLSEH